MAKNGWRLKLSTGAMLAGVLGASLSLAVSGPIQQSAVQRPATKHPPLGRARPTLLLSRAKAPFVIELRLRGKVLSTAQQATLQAAANRVAGLITSTYQPVTLNLPANDCDKGFPTIKERLNHFVAYITVKDLGDDVYGDSAPCSLHDKTYLPIYGAVDLNSRGLSDLAEPELRDTIIHELLHALGVGTLWTADERVSLSGESDNKNLVAKRSGKWYYTAPKALAAYQALGGKGKGILLDPDQGHWAGDVVCSEILSGSAGDVTDRVNPISAITLGALTDLGYSVNPKLADKYALPKGRCPLN
ncbi:hypothetical protein EHF33_10560 [Deinococcus psychrotolerans]|uniref:Leishmanolysin n=1 Tax=Deinococcus psychrotolerans TaxID=2489213 RepID=A0A3G8YDW9_9DEIO|nr:hypothetical protein [Deinococcus psychrotolerans]AZI43123.1 hypothetical protein EHF33_10560 [Deinococcus psychrotolerans]